MANDSEPSGQRRRFLRTAGAVTVGSLLAGCTGGNGGSGDGSGGSGGDGSGETTKESKTKSLTLAASQTGAVGLVTRVMLDQEFDKAHDLKVEPKYMSIPQAEKALVNKQVETAPLPPITAGRLNLRGNSLRGLRPFHEIHESAIVRSSDNISDLKGLQGVKLGSLSRSSGLYTVFSLLVRMSDHNLDQYDVRTASPSALYGLMLKGDLDSTLHFDPFAARLLVRDKFEELFYYSDMWNNQMGNPIPVAEVGVWQKTVDAKPGALKALSQSLNDAGKYIQQNPDKVFKNYQKALGAENDRQLAKIKERMKGIYPAEFSTSMRAGSKQLIQKAAELGEYEQIEGGSEPPIDEIFIDPTSL